MRRSLYYDDDVVSEIRKMRERMTVWIMDLAVTEKNFTSAVRYLDGFKDARNIFIVRNGSTVWLLRNFIAGLAHAPIKTRPTLYSFNGNEHGDANKSYAETVKHLSKCYLTGDIVAKAN